MSHPGADFLHLNRDGEWPGFSRRNLDVDGDGELSLASLPALDASEEIDTSGAGAGDGPEGLAVAPDGAVFWTGPSEIGRTVFRRDPCDGHCAPLPLDPDAELDDPRGLAVHPGRGALLIADRGRDRIVLVALDSLQLIGVWGGSGGGPGELDGPTGLAVGDDGTVHVVDGGNGRVQRLSAGGAPLASYTEATDPVAIAVAGEALWIVDGAERALIRHHPQGASERMPLDLGGPSALAAKAGALYAGDAVAERAVRIDPADARTVGEARGYTGHVAALAIGDDLWLHPGGGARPRRLALHGATVRRGILWGGPISLGDDPHAWTRLAAVGGIDSGRATLFVHASDDPAGPPDPDPAGLREANGGFAAPWTRIGDGGPDGLVRRTSKLLWVGVLFASDGRPPGPRIGQLRISFDQVGYEEHLPVIYRAPEKIDLEGSGPEPLERFLALFESHFRDVEASIDDLRRLFDPASTPSEWIEWLASWLAEPLDEAWPEGRKRALIASAFERAAWRGTAVGLRRNLAERLGIRASVEEPHAQTGWWTLAPGDPEPGAARLGITTRLPASEPNGAVLDRSAVVDGSQLIEDEDVGEPLFWRTAYQFSVVLPRAQVSAPATRDRVEELVGREKPAHTLHCLRLVDPGLTVGYQALLGVDTLLGDGSAVPSRLGERSGPLAIEGHRPIEVGAGRLGVTTRLAAGVEPPDNQMRREEKPWAS